MVRSAGAHGFVSVLCGFSFDGLFFRFFRLLGFDRLGVKVCSLRAILLFLVLLLVGFTRMPLFCCSLLPCFQEAAGCL